MTFKSSNEKTPKNYKKKTLNCRMKKAQKIEEKKRNLLVTVFKMSIEKRQKTRKKRRMFKC